MSQKAKSSRQKSPSPARAKAPPRKPQNRSVKETPTPDEEKSPPNLEPLAVPPALGPSKAPDDIENAEKGAPAVDPSEQKAACPDWEAAREDDSTGQAAQATPRIDSASDGSPALAQPSRQPGQLDGEGASEEDGAGIDAVPAMEWQEQKEWSREIRDLRAALETVQADLGNYAEQFRLLQFQIGEFRRELADLEGLVKAGRNLP